MILSVVTGVEEVEAGLSLVLVIPSVVTGVEEMEAGSSLVLLIPSVVTGVEEMEVGLSSVLVLVISSVEGAESGEESLVPVEGEESPVSVEGEESLVPVEGEESLVPVEGEESLVPVEGEESLVLVEGEESPEEGVTSILPVESVLLPLLVGVEKMESLLLVVLIKPSPVDLKCTFFTINGTSK